MVNKVHKMNQHVVKVEKAGEKERKATSKGGIGLAHSVAQRMRLWSDVKKDVPERKDPTQGYETVSVVASEVYGLLTGGRGFSATEPMRKDTPLLEILGLDRAPSSETVEGVVKYLALESEGMKGLRTTISRFVNRGISLGKRSEIRCARGFVPLWVDGSLLEVYGKRFDAIKAKKGQRGQMCVGAFVGPWLTGIDFAQEGEGEETVGRRLLTEAIDDVVRPNKLLKEVLILMDSLYGDGPTFDQIEGIRGKPRYIVGVQGLREAERVMTDMAPISWRETGADASRNWIESSVGMVWLQCTTWKKKRLMVCRRWKEEGDMFWHYAGVATNLTEQDRRIRDLMGRSGKSFEEIIWMLYSYKQGMENQWKDLLNDMQLHNPSCAKAAVNAVLYAIAGIAYNLAVAVRRLALEGTSRVMRLWRLRREVFDLPGYVVAHSRYIILRVLDARDHLVDQMVRAMGRVLLL